MLLVSPGPTQRKRIELQTVSRQNNGVPKGTIPGQLACPDQRAALVLVPLCAITVMCSRYCRRNSSILLPAAYHCLKQFSRCHFKKCGCGRSDRRRGSSA